MMPFFANSGEFTCCEKTVYRYVNGGSAIKLFEIIYGEGILDTLGIRLVPPNDVNLTPGLLGK